MKKVTTILMSCVFVFGAYTSVHSQTANNKVVAGLSATFVDYKGMASGKLFSIGNQNPGARLGAGFYLNDWVNLGVNSAIVPRASFPKGDGSYESQMLFDVNTGVALKFNNNVILNEEAVVAPYIFTGLGYTSSEGKNGAYLPGALGLNVRLGANTRLFVESMYRVKLGRTIQPMSNTIGFAFTLPSNKPAKNKMVENEAPAKPAPKPIITNNPSNGKVAQAPTAKKPQTAAGATPKPTIVSTPTQSALTPVEESIAKNSKPQPSDPFHTDKADNDGDGIPNLYDGCPDAFGAIEEGGCPVRERIGEAMTAKTVYDEEVAMPQTAPERDVLVSPLQRHEVATTSTVKEEVASDDLNRLRVIEKNLKFKPESDILLPSSQPYMDELVQILLKYPGYKLVVDGHYDDNPSEVNNKFFSVKRAFKVKSLLVATQKLPLVRIDPDGYGSELTPTGEDSRIVLHLEKLK